MADMITFGEPDVRRDNGAYVFDWMSQGQPLMRVQVSDVRMDKDAIFGEFTVWWLLDQSLGVRPVQPASVLKLNSSHSTGWRSIPRELSKRMPDVDFEGALTIVVDEVMTRYEIGEPTVALHEQEKDHTPPFLLEPWISSTGNTVMYGEGGLSKSLLALAMAVTVSTGAPVFGRTPHTVGPVIIFDYEDDHQTHVNRLFAICRSFGIPIGEAKVYHHSLSAKVTTSQREMRKRVHETGAVLGILDSVGMGRGGSAVASEDTIRMFRALRAIGIPFLSIDHISKESKKSSGADRDAYGSVYTMNSARLGWSLTRELTSDGLIHIRASNTKHNHVPKQKAQSMTVGYRNDDNGVPEFIDIEVRNDDGMLMPSIDTHERMQMSLGSHDEWRTYEQLSDELGIKETTLRSTTHRDQAQPTPLFETKTVSRRVWIRCVAPSVAAPRNGPATQAGDDDETQ